MKNEIHELRTAFEAIAEKLSTDPKQARTVAAARSALNDLINAYISLPQTIEIHVEQVEAKPYKIELEVTSCET